MTEQEMFNVAYALVDREARTSYLDKACGQDEELRKRLDALLAACDEPSDFLSVPAYQLLDPRTRQVAGGSQIDTTDKSCADTLPSADCNAQYAAEPARLHYFSASSNSTALGALGHYEIVEQLGQGAFGTVFKALDQRLHRHVAIKVMAPELASQATFRQRFLREARSAAAVKHPNIVLVYEVEEQPIPYMVMELIDGPSLQQYYDDGHRFSVLELIQVGQQIAGALSTAHVGEMIHRDIKPGNILIDVCSEDFASSIKVSDFGLARMIDDDSLSRSGLIAGTPMYMSPEQTLGEPLDCRADLFSLGSVLYMLATGRPPFEKGSTVEVMKQVARATPAPIQSINSEIPDWLCGLIVRLQARDPRERFQSAPEVEAILAAESNRLRSGVAEGSHTWPQNLIDTNLRPSAPQLFHAVSAVDSSGEVRLRGKKSRWLTIYSVASTALNGLLLCWLSWLWWSYRPTQSLSPISLPVDQPIAENKDASAPRETSSRKLPATKTSEPTSWAGWPVDAPQPAKSKFSALQARQHQESWAKYLGVPQEFTNSFNIKFVLIPPGEFQMGSTAEEVENLNQQLKDGAALYKEMLTEVPRHLVTIPQPFYLSVCEITQQQYREITGSNPSRFSSTNWREPKTWLTNTNEFPVESVTWNDAIKFCNQLSEKDSRQAAYKVVGESVLQGQGAGYRLPGEAEWEYACRAGTTTDHWSGDALKETDWIRTKDYTIVTKKVGQLKPNPFELHDMQGNVSEWTEEYYRENAYSQGAHLRTSNEPPSSATPPEPILRGGAYLQVPVKCRAAYRHFQKPDWKADSVGFRLAFSVITMPADPSLSRNTNDN